MCYGMFVTVQAAVPPAPCARLRGAGPARDSTSTHGVIFITFNMWLCNMFELCRQLYHLRHARDYEELGLPMGASKMDIKKAYK